jgi:hypothetical protein
MKIEDIATLKDEKVIAKILESGEDEKVEFKASLPPPIEIARTIASFANSRGGLLIIGIDEDNEKIGLDKLEQEEFGLYVGNAKRCIKPVPCDLDWDLIEFRGDVLGAVLVQATDTHRFTVDRVYFRRLGAVNLKLTLDEYMSMEEKNTTFDPLVIDESEIGDFIKKCDEDAFCEVLLVPFLRHIGFRSVQRKGHTDKTLEFGQDIRSFKIDLPTGHWLYFAAQVKKKDLIYSPAETDNKENIEKVITQLNMAFDHEMFDPETGTKILPDHVLLVATGSINEGAREHLANALSRDKRRRILFWSGELIMERVLKLGLPEGCQLAISRYNRSIER